MRSFLQAILAGLRAAFLTPFWLLDGCFTFFRNMYSAPRQTDFEDAAAARVGDIVDRARAQASQVRSKSVDPAAPPFRFAESKSERMKRPEPKKLPDGSYDVDGAVRSYCARALLNSKNEPENQLPLPDLSRIDPRLDAWAGLLSAEQMRLVMQRTNEQLGSFASHMNGSKLYDGVPRVLTLMQYRDLEHALATRSAISAGIAQRMSTKHESNDNEDSAPVLVPRFG